MKQEKTVPSASTAVLDSEPDSMKTLNSESKLIVDNNCSESQPVMTIVKTEPKVVNNKNDEEDTRESTSKQVHNKKVAKPIGSIKVEKTLKTEKSVLKKLITKKSSNQQPKSLLLDNQTLKPDPKNEYK